MRGNRKERISVRCGPRGSPPLARNTRQGRPRPGTPPRGASRLEDRSGLPTGTSVKPATLPASNRRAKRATGGTSIGSVPFFCSFYPHRRPMSQPATRCHFGSGAEGDGDLPPAASGAVTCSNACSGACSGGCSSQPSDRVGSPGGAMANRLPKGYALPAERRRSASVSGWEAPRASTPGFCNLPRFSSACPRIKGSTCRRSAT